MNEKDEKELLNQKALKVLEVLEDITIKQAELIISSVNRALSEKSRTLQENILKNTPVGRFRIDEDD